MSEKRVSVRLRAEGGGQVRAEFEGVGDSGERAFARIGRQADATGALIRRLTGVLAAFFSARQIGQYADSWTDLQSRVQLAVGSHEAGIAVMGRLGDMARRTYSDLNQTVESWLSNSTALRELGMSTRESLDFTEALNNALVVSGARAERAAQINNALSQAMALGRLSGQGQSADKRQERDFHTKTPNEHWPFKPGQMAIVGLARGKKSTFLRLNAAVRAPIGCGANRAEVIDHHPPRHRAGLFLA